MNLLRSAAGGLAAALLLIGVFTLACSDDGSPLPVALPEAQPNEASQTADGRETQSGAESDDGDESQTQTGQQLQPERQRAEETAQAAQSDDSPQQGGGRETSDTPVGVIPPLAAEPILGGYRFEQPIEMAMLPDGSVLIAEQRGSITRFVERDGGVQQFGVLDLTESIVFRGERGLLSMALAPDFDARPYLFVYYSPRGTNLSRLSRFEMRDGAALPDSELVIIEIEQPYANHNGGAVRFGPDGMLYLGIGDGGAANDPHDHGQNTETLLGSIIRIDVREISASTPYRIPTDNPFLGRAGFRPEIWAYGLRNPWRMAFDRETGALWVGDVGQDRFEEIAIVRRGENHGWNVFEGGDCFRSQERCDDLVDAAPPVAVYSHPMGCSVTGGIVYRGAAIPGLDGRYIFGDYCAGAIWTIDAGAVVETGLELGGRIASFAVDSDGEIHALVFGGPIYRLIPAGR